MTALEAALLFELSLALVFLCWICWDLAKVIKLVFRARHVRDLARDMRESDDWSKVIDKMRKP
jgi:hypothetical protein